MCSLLDVYSAVRAGYCADRLPFCERVHFHLFMMIFWVTHVIWLALNMSSELLTEIWSWTAQLGHDLFLEATSSRLEINAQVSSQPASHLCIVCCTMSQLAPSMHPIAIQSQADLTIESSLQALLAERLEFALIPAGAAWGAFSTGGSLGQQQDFFGRVGIQASC